MGKRFQYNGPQTPGKNTPQQYIAKIASHAINASLNSGILPSVLIGKTLQESANGNDYKAFYFNNPFGHMAFKTWSGDGVRKGTGKAPYWRVYPSLAEGFRAAVGILKQGKFKLEGVSLKTTPKAQLDSLQKAGYNVGPDRKEYAAKINRIIAQYDLEKYDRQLRSMERELNGNNLAFHEQDPITKALHNLFA